MKKIITISGNGGSGKSTIANLLADKLKYKCYFMGDIMRKIASENNMDIVTFQEQLKNNPEYDHKVDDMIIELSKDEEEIIFVSRTAWHFIPDSYKVYLYVSENEAARRIFNDDIRINEKKYETLEEAKQFSIRRNQLEIDRYKNIYGIDVSNKDNYDFVLDTSNLTINQVLEKIVEKYNEVLERM